MVTLNHAVAVAVVRGPEAGLALLTSLENDDRMAKHHRLDAVRAHLLEMAGDRAAARVSYRRPHAAKPACPNGGASRPRPPGYNRSGLGGHGEGLRRSRDDAAGVRRVGSSDRSGGNRWVVEACLS
jgi:hypothetical protein